MNKGLGKGLGAFFPNVDINEDDKVIQIPLSKLRANPYQPRKTFHDDSIDELAISIKENGVIQPIIVRSVLKGFEIIAGERRWRASQKCNLETIPAVVKNFTDQQVMEIALIENLQREDLNALEIAQAYQSLIDHFQYTQEELSGKVGKSRSHIANFLRLLQLPEEVKHYVSRGTLSMGHARAIAGLKKPEEIKEIAAKAIRNDWSVRDVEEEIKRMEESVKSSSRVKKKKMDPYIHEMEEQLREKYRTTVRIKHVNNKGKIELSYYSKEDLERLLELLGSLSS